MSKLYKLKEWFSLEDAAKRLGSGLGEPVSTEDLLQLVVEGHLPLSWFARHVTAERVTQICYLDCLVPPLFEKEWESKQYVGRVTWHGHHAYREHVGRKKGDALHPYATLQWAPRFGKQFVEHIDGVFRLELAECGALQDWVHSLLTNTGGELISLDGYYVSDAEGTMWRILGHAPAATYKLPDGAERKREAFYYPSGEFPEPAELVIQRSDIEAFETRIGRGEQEAPIVTSARERRTLLNVIGGLLELLLGKTPSGRLQSVYESQAAVIDALLARHSRVAGITKRTLEDKLAEAKRGLASS